MTHSSIADNDPPRRSRVRRREAMINTVATILGCVALVVMIATVVRVVMMKLWESARVNPEYAQTAYDSPPEHRPPGNSKSQSAHTNETDGLAGLYSSDSPSAAPAAALTEPPSAPSLPLSTAQSVVGNAAFPSAIQDIESKRALIEATVRGYFQANGIDQRLGFARDPQRVRPLMVHYARSHPSAHLEWKELGWVLPVEEPGYRLGYAQAIFTNAEPASLIIEEMTDGSFRVDWESSVRYSELSWGEFIQTQPADPKLFRVIASKPQNSPPDPAPLGSEMLEIKHPDDNNVIYAYFDRNDPKFQPLLQQLQAGNWKDVPLTLRLCYPSSTSGGKSAQIAEVEGKGWLILHGTRS